MKARIVLIAFAVIALFSSADMLEGRKSCDRCDRFIFGLFNKGFCRECGGVVNWHPEVVQPLDADTLYFSNENNLRGWLVQNNLASKYPIKTPKYSFLCDNSYDTNIYPSQLNDDYLNESRFVGLPNVSLIDHIRTRKMKNVFIPGAIELAQELNEAHANGTNITILDQYGSVAYSGTPEGALPLLYKNVPDSWPLSTSFDFCNVWEYYTNPETGQVVCFKDVYNWWNIDGEQIFNVNQKIYQVFGLNSGVVHLPIDAVHMPTGLNYGFDLKYVGHDIADVRMEGVEDVFPYRN